MSEPPPPPSMLAYESAVPGRISNTRQAAWITLLVVGLLNVLGGLCLGGSVLFVTYLALPRPPSPIRPVQLSHWRWAIAAIYLVLPPAAGITEIICCFKVRNCSVSAAKVAAAVIGLQILAIVAVLTLNVISLMIHGASAPPIPMFLAFAFLLVAASALAATEFLLIKVLREARLRPA